MALVSNQSLTNVYQEYLLQVKGGRCVGILALPPLCADFLEIWEPQSPGTQCECIRLEQEIKKKKKERLLDPYLITVRERPSRPALGPTQPSILWVPALSPGKTGRSWRRPPTPI
jgi:hypothetical protein